MDAELKEIARRLEALKRTEGLSEGLFDALNRVLVELRTLMLFHSREIKERRDDPEDEICR